MGRRLVLTATRGRTASVAFQASAVANQGEVAAFTTVFAFIPLHLGLLNPGGGISTNAG